MMRNSSLYHYLMVIFVIFSNLASFVGAEEDNDEKLFERFASEPNSESYVVVIFSSEYDKSIKKPSYNLKGTIVGIIKGNMNIADIIDFSKVTECEVKSDVFLGKMYIVQRLKAPIDDSPISGEFYVPAHHPGAFVACSPKLYKLITQFDRRNTPNK